MIINNLSFLLALIIYLKKWEREMYLEYFFGRHCFSLHAHVHQCLLRTGNTAEVLSYFRCCLALSFALGSVWRVFRAFSWCRCPHRGRWHWHRVRRETFIRQDGLTTIKTGGIRGRHKGSERWGEGKRSSWREEAMEYSRQCFGSALSVE